MTGIHSPPFGKTLPYTLTCTTRGDRWKGGTIPAEYRIVSEATGKLIGFVKKVEGGYWRSRNSEGDTTPCFTRKTRRLAAKLLYNTWAEANNEPLILT